MTPGRASVSDFRHIAPYEWESDPCIGESDPSWGDGVEESSAVSTLRWGAVSTVPTDCKTGAVALPGDVCQVSLSEGESWSEPQQRLTRKLPRKIKQPATLAAENPADRTVRIADFTWQLPPNPEEGGLPSSLTFLIGAAISSSESEGMKLADICQWIEARYPRRRALDSGSVSGILNRRADFIEIKPGVSVGGKLWKLRNPQVFGGFYEKDISRYRFGMALESIYRNVSPAADGDTHLAPALPVEIGGHIITLPPHSADRTRPPLRLLCGCAIALDPEQGAGAHEIAEWIADRYSMRGGDAMKALKRSTSKALRRFKNDFRRKYTNEQVRTAGRTEMKWVLQSPSAFAASYKERVYSWGYLSVVSKQQVTGQPLSATGHDPTAPPDSRSGAVVSPADMRQVSPSKGESSPEPQQLLTRKRSREAEQTVTLPCAKKPTDRTVQIADFTWQLPPEPEEGGPYPSPAFLIGAAISSSESEGMNVADICQWIRARYPRKMVLDSRSISGILSRKTHFIEVKPGISVGKILWKLRNPKVFREGYEKDIFKYRVGTALDSIYRNVSPAADGDTHLAPALPVEIGGHIITLPPHSADRTRPPLRLLCGCAIALDSEQGASANEIAEWIADRYSIQGEDAMRVLKCSTSRALRKRKNDFLRTDIRERAKPIRGRLRMKWVLKSPSAFAASYEGSIYRKGSIYRRGHLAVVFNQQDTGRPLSDSDQDSSVGNQQDS